jgi:hypothetical protein
MEELRTQAEYQSANDPLGLPEAAAQEIVNRLLGSFQENGPPRIASGVFLDLKKS